MGPGVWRVRECNTFRTGDPSTPCPPSGTSCVMALGAGTTRISGVFWGWPSSAGDPRRPRRLHRHTLSQWFPWAWVGEEGPAVFRRCDKSRVSAFPIQLSALLSFGSLAVSWLLCHARCRTLSSTWHVQTTSGSPPSRPHPVLALDAEVPEMPRAPARLTEAQSRPQAVGQCQCPARRLLIRPGRAHGREHVPGLPHFYPGPTALTSTRSSQGVFCVF